MSRLAGLILALTLAAQWLLPTLQIVDSERILRDGQRYYFRTAPIDPVDAFRGRYVALAYRDTEVSWAGPAVAPAGMTVYVPLQRGADGFAVLGAAQSTPAAQTPFLRVTVRESLPGRRLRVSLPFDRYYLREDEAPRIEQQYRDTLRAGGQAYVAVRVRNGRARIEELFINNVPLRQLRDR